MIASNAPAQSRLPASRQLCTFSVAGHFFGVDVRAVQEVINLQPMTAVPLAPPAVRGLINLRGQIVTAIDLRRRLELPATEEEHRINVVVYTPDGPVSLLVDEIGDVIEVQAKSYEPRPETLQGVARELIAGVYKLEKRLLLVLDIERAVAVSALGRASSAAPDQQEFNPALVGKI